MANASSRSRDAWTKAGKTLDMGKSCVRFKRLDDVPLQVIGQAIRRVPAKKFVEQYESVTKRAGGKRATKAAPRKRAAKKSVPKKRDRG